MSSDLTIPVLDRMIALADQCTAVVDVLVLDSAEKEAQAAALLRIIASQIKDAEEERKALVKPIKAKAAVIDAQFRDPRKRLETLERKIRTRLAEAESKRLAARQEAQRAAIEATQAGDLTKANEALVAVGEAAQAPPEGITYRYRYEVEGYTLRDVPDEYLALHQARVAAEVQRQTRAKPDEEPRIPGIRFKKVAIPVARKA